MYPLFLLLDGALRQRLDGFNRVHVYERERLRQNVWGMEPGRSQTVTYSWNGQELVLRYATSAVEDPSVSIRLWVWLLRVWAGRIDHSSYSFEVIDGDGEDTRQLRDFLDFMREVDALIGDFQKWAM